MEMVHFNWTLGWALMMLGLVSGALLGLSFHRRDFLGGYDAWQRRLVRLGHIAFMALGMLNLIYAVGGHADGIIGCCTSAALAVGSITTPLVCFASAWSCRLKWLFAIPVAALALAMALAFWSSL